MNILKNLDQMEQLQELKYRQQQRSFQRLIAEESRLRTALSQLKTHLQESRGNGDVAQRAIGADVLWQGWIGRKRAELNVQLAQVLAIKEQHIRQVRQAYGKLLVSRELHARERNIQKAKMTQAHLDCAIESSLIL